MLVKNGGHRLSVYDTDFTNCTAGSLDGEPTGKNGVVGASLSDDVLVSNCTFTGCGSDGVSGFESRRGHVQLSTFHTVYGSFSDCVQPDFRGDRAPDAAWTLVYNTFDKRGQDGLKGCVVLFGDRHLVGDNAFFGGHFGLSFAGSHSTAAYNTFTDVALDNTWGGALYVGPNKPVTLTGNTYHHNTVTGCRRGISLVGGLGPRLDFVFEHNVILDSTDLAADIGAPTSGRFTFNTLDTGYRYTGGEILGEPWVVDHNLYLGFTGPGRSSVRESERP